MALRPSPQNCCLIPDNDGGRLWAASGCGATARRAADLVIIPVVIEDACGAGHADAAQHCCEALRLADDAIATIATDTGRFVQRSAERYLTTRHARPCAGHPRLHSRK
jgi:hypothetical protein